MGFVANLNIIRAPERTRERRPRVRAFQVFRAMRARARGSRAVALNFRPSRKGMITFLTKPRSGKEEILSFNHHHFVESSISMVA